MEAVPANEAAGSARWLSAEQARLLSFARGSRIETGFGWLDGRGGVAPGSDIHTWITCRMTHVFALSYLQGDLSAAELVDHGLTALTGVLHDSDHGGWYSAVDAGGRPLSETKDAYTHAFVLLAAASGYAAGRPGATELLADALATIEARFWRADERALVESWNRSWTRAEPYRGANSNMHAVEAFTAVADVTGRSVWRDRAVEIADRIVHRTASTNHWRVIEHFDERWQPMPDYNRDRPDDPFRPYGSTIGHWFEWARLMAGLHTALPAGPRWLLEDAVQLFSAAVREGWDADGAPGFVYTVDWSGEPVVRTRMHWVLAEAIGAAAVLQQVAGDPVYAAWLQRWWDYAEIFIDRTDGGWHHELSASHTPSATVWNGKPDAYHAVQATLLPRLPAAPSLIEAVHRQQSGAAAPPA